MSYVITTIFSVVCLGVITLSGATMRATLSTVPPQEHEIEPVAGQGDMRWFVSASDRDDESAQAIEASGGGQRMRRLAAASGGSTCARAETLDGEPGSSSRWGSGWIDLLPEVHLKRGDQLQLRVGGSAKKVLVRILRDLRMADEPVGVEGGVRDVPVNRIVKVVLERDYSAVRQISVHGGPRAWSWSLGDNGAATLVSVQRCLR